MAASPGPVGAGALVQGAQPTRSQERDRRSRAQASGRPVEVCDPGHRHRGSGDEDRRLSPACLRNPNPNPSRPDQPRPIRVDEPMDCRASNAATKNGLVLSSLPAASGMLVPLPQATTECEFDLASKPRLPNRLEPWIADQRSSPSP